MSGLRKTFAISALALLPLAPSLDSCGGGPSSSSSSTGTVVSKSTTSGVFGKTHWVTVRERSGKKRAHNVDQITWGNCHVGDKFVGGWDPRCR